MSSEDLCAQCGADGCCWVPNCSTKRVPLAVSVPDLTIQNSFLKTDVQSKRVHLEFPLHFLLEEEIEVFCHLSSAPNVARRVGEPRAGWDSAAGPAPLPQGQPRCPRWTWPRGPLKHVYFHELAVFLWLKDRPDPGLPACRTLEPVLICLVV